MPRRIPEDIEAWINGLRKLPEVTLDDEEKKNLADMLNHRIMQAALVKVVEGCDARCSAADGLNFMLPGEAAEALRLQGEKRALTAMFETLWETANVEV